MFDFTATLKVPVIRSVQDWFQQNLLMNLNLNLNLNLPAGPEPEPAPAPEPEPES